VKKIQKKGWKINHRRTNIWAKIKEEKEMKKTRPP
jgi:hypothetical protein